MRSISGKIVKCNCGAIIEYDNSETYNYSGFRMLDCPECGRQVELEQINLLNFPQSFDKNDGVKVEDETITKWVEQCVEKLKRNIDSDFQCVSSGDSLVFVYWCGESEIQVIVAKNYWENYIDLEEWKWLH